MSNFIVEILEPATFVLDVSSGTYADLPNIYLDVVNTEKILVSDLPDDIPMSMIVGNLPVSRIDGLDEYLSEIPVDGGSP
jgi:hypothetical protein